MTRYRHGFFAGLLRELLQELRDTHDLSQNRLAEMIGQAPSTVSDWCNRRSLPESDDDLRTLAEKLARTLDRNAGGVFAGLRHAVHLDILEHTLRERLGVSLDTAADLLDELRLEHRERGS